MHLIIKYKSKKSSQSGDHALYEVKRSQHQDGSYNYFCAKDDIFLILSLIINNTHKLN